MKCTKCRSLADIKPIRIRYTPTFHHQPIFDDYQSTRIQPHHCSPTYYSTVLDQNHSLPQNRTQCCCSKDQTNNGCCCSNSVDQANVIKKRQSISASKVEKQRATNSQKAYDTFTFSKRGLSNHKLLWFDPEKQLILKEAANCMHHGYSKERKLIELSSNPLVHPEINLAHTQCIRCFPEQEYIRKQQDPIKIQEDDGNRAGEKEQVKRSVEESKSPKNVEKTPQRQPGCTKKAPKVKKVSKRK